MSHSFLRIFRGETKADVIKECGICFDIFKEEDEVVECVLVHVYHSSCFEDNKENDKDDKCHQCHNPMKLTRSNPALHRTHNNFNDTSLLGNKASIRNTTGGIHNTNTTKMDSSVSDVSGVSGTTFK